MGFSLATVQNAVFSESRVELVQSSCGSVRGFHFLTSCRNISIVSQYHGRLVSHLLAPAHVDRLFGPGTPNPIPSAVGYYCGDNVTALRADDISTQVATLEAAGETRVSTCP